MSSNSLDPRSIAPTVTIDGIPCYGPEFAKDHSSFPEAILQELSRVEEHSFWYRCRRRIITELTKKYLKPPSPCHYLEVGCGTGYVLQGLSQIQHLHIYASDISLEGLRRARQSNPTIRFMQLDLMHSPFEEAFDAVGAFDVLEHIPDDGAVLRNIARALKPGGYFFLTVPQHPLLWSPTDVYARHHRRYTRAGLVSLLQQENFDVCYASSFVSLLFPALVLSRVTNKGKPGSLSKAGFETSMPQWLDFICDVTLRIETFFIVRGWSFPWGGSLVIVARKRVFDNPK